MNAYNVNVFVMHILCILCAALFQMFFYTQQTYVLDLV